MRPFETRKVVGAVPTRSTEASLRTPSTSATLPIEKESGVGTRPELIERSAARVPSDKIESFYVIAWMDDEAFVCVTCGDTEGYDMSFDVWISLDQFVNFPRGLRCHTCGEYIVLPEETGTAFK